MNPVSRAISSTFGYVYLTDAQYIAAFCAGVFSSCLSLFGSSSIIYLIVKTGKLNEIYHRLVFGLSVMDLIVTTSILLQPYLLPRYTGYLFAVGNVQTCEFVAFFFHFFIASYIYNAELSVYFLMTVRYGKKEDELKRKMEPWVHIFPVLVAVVFGVVAIVLDLFNPGLLLGICEFAPFPVDCVQNEAVECIRGSLEDEVSWAHAIITFLAILIGIICTWLIYWTVRQQTRKSGRWTGTGQLSEQQQKRTRAVGIQAIWYTVAFMVGFIVTLFASVINAVYTNELEDISQLSGNAAIYAAFFLVWLLFPMQGFFNWLIYIRPRLVRWKDANPEKSWFWAYRQVLSAKTPPNTRRTNHLISRPRNRTSVTASLPQNYPKSASSIEEGTAHSVSRATPSRQQSESEEEKS